MNTLKEIEGKPQGSIRLGVMGLISKSWIETSIVNTTEYKLEKSVSTAKYISSILKEKFNCDFVIALTHMTNDEDMNLQNAQTGVDICKNYAKLIASLWRPRASLHVQEVHEFFDSEKWSQFQNLQRGHSFFSRIG